MNNNETNTCENCEHKNSEHYIKHGKKVCGFKFCKCGNQGEKYKQVAILKEVFCINCSYSIQQEKDVTICLNTDELEQKAELLHENNKDKTWCENPKLLVKYDSARLSVAAYNELAKVKNG